MLSFVPNFITSLNILSGCLSIVLAFEGYLVFSAYFIVIAAIFDFLDGLSARLLNAYSELGKELDSLADIISFGVAPSIIIYHLLKKSMGIESLILNFNEIAFYKILFLSSAFIIAIFSGIRLAKFNIDTRQTTSFIGLPTPANAIWIASLPLILNYSEYSFCDNIILNPYFLIASVILSSILLIAEFPMFSFKMKSLDFKKYKIQFIFILISVILLIILHLIAIPLIIFVYILLSGINNWIIKDNK
ncbi:MAG: CDP-diacylglycerol--serine O-phosphatidyltransferase [Bacteroidales bacterium]|nr:CDP-diacylglycerol--serine O-phosphatidyltransferase [Bacteroidales bacterium]